MNAVNRKFKISVHLHGTKLILNGKCRNNKNNNNLGMIIPHKIPDN